MASHHDPLAPTDPAQQTLLLTLPAPVKVPARLRLDTHTRQVDLAGVAAARAILAEQAERRMARERASALPHRRAA